MKKYVAALSIPALVALSACSNPEHYETDPVQVQTSRGIVTCQIYLTSMVVWDRSIDRPSNMGVKEADEYCRRAGYEIKGVDYAG